MNLFGVRKPLFVLVAIILAVPAWGCAPDHGPALDREVDLSEWFEGVEPADATFVVLGGETGGTIRFNSARAREGFLPASTFKIPNTLIALESGVADGPEFALEWDGEVPEEGFWTEAWSQDHTLASAMSGSVVWFYRELARRIGADRMEPYLERFQYGNATVGDDPDGFWLGGDLRISAEEQVRFLRDLYEGNLEVSEDVVEVLKDLIVLEDGAQYRISGKTGTSTVTAGRELAWLVGWVETPGERVSYFALNMEGEEVWERWGPLEVRLDLARTLLREVGALPQD